MITKANFLNIKWAQRNVGSNGLDSVFNLADPMGAIDKFIVFFLLGP